MKNLFSLRLKKRLYYNISFSSNFNDFANSSFGGRCHRHKNKSPVAGRCFVFNKPLFAGFNPPLRIQHQKYWRKTLEKILYWFFKGGFGLVPRPFNYFFAVWQLSADLYLRLCLNNSRRPGAAEQNFWIWIFKMAWLLPPWQSA